MLKRTLKKLGLPIVALAGMMMFVGAPKADAAVRFGVYLGGPVYPYAYPYPYYGYRYAYPYGYGYYHRYPYYPYRFYGGYWGGWRRHWDRD
jgi:hypothetical protein